MEVIRSGVDSDVVLELVTGVTRTAPEEERVRSQLAVRELGSPVEAVRGSLPMLSIVTPVYNESEVLPEFHRRMTAVLDALGLQAEIIYVNDGSKDATLEILFGLHNCESRVAIVNLSRNFGKEIVMTKGRHKNFKDVARTCNLFPRLWYFPQP